MPPNQPPEPSTTSPSRPPQPTLGELISRISENLTALVRGEIDLFKAQARITGKHLGLGAGILAAASVMALFGLGYILGSLTEALALALPMWAAKLIVAIVLLFVAFIAARAGMKKLEEGRQSMPDPRTSIQADVDAVTASFTAGLSKGEQK